ncbi:unnamed protein product [Nesidiocoris tenuis]|uniref:Neuroglian n=1 Tax=Nesidiocoris tenuis TaxID=355587 RepID=A0A6H5GMC6_9HEMI|nr:unnamed protein product [Nesidiocoris tenuis]
MLLFKSNDPDHIEHVCSGENRSSQTFNQSPPRIVKQPPSDELLFQVYTRLETINEKPFVIECEAEGEPAPKYQWVKNGKRFNWQAYDDRISQQPGRGTLVISSPRDEDLGQYQCFASNEWGTATSNSVFVRKAELNAFKDQSPLSVQAQEGEPFKLTCNPPDGWPKPNVYWLIQRSDGGIESINNSRMTVDPEGNLWFSNVTKRDATNDFAYACAATSLFRSEYKIGNRVLLNVVASGVSASQNRHPPVKQYVTRKNEVAIRGSKVQLFCIYGGTPLPHTVWSYNGKPLQLSERVSQEHFGKSLLLKHVEFSDKGTYTCEVSNGQGQVQSYSITLNVLAAPYFTVEPEIVNAAEDETAELVCEASGDPEPQIKWIHNGLPISEAPLNPRRKVTPNKIVIEKLTKKDTGNYGCNATNSIGYVYKDVYINVLAVPPEIIEPPTNKEVVDGKTVIMTCRVFGAPKPEVKWVRNRVELTGGRYTILPQGDLEIKEINFLDAGVYDCHAANKLGSQSRSATLQVKEHTRITEKPEDYEVAEGSTATFRCNAVSDSSLNLTIDWQNNGHLIDFESEPRFVKTNDFSLTITKTNELDSGVYTCVASTPLDEATASATLIVQAVPNAPELVSVECNKMDAKISWHPLGDNRAPILRYTIQYNTTFTPDVWEDAYDNVPATDQTYTVAMSPWANYTFRVLAWNKIGQSQPSSHSKVCSTQPDVPYKNPDNVEGKGTDPTNMVISWTPMPEIEHNAPKFQYRVSWRRDIPSEPYSSYTINDWRTSQYVVNNLQTFEKFVIKVVALNEKGESNVAAKEVYGYSGEDVPTESPTNFTLVQVLSSTGASLRWNPVSQESVRGHFEGYKIQTWTDKDTEGKMREIIINGRSTFVSAEDKFIPNSKNFARVLVFNSRYNGPPSETINFDTPEGVPGTVQSLEAVPLGSSGLLLMWKKPEQTNGILTGYKIYYQTVKGTKVGPLLERQPSVTDPKQTRVKLAGLEPATKYRIHIKATTAAGEGEGYFIEHRTRGSVSVRPDPPSFHLVHLDSDNGYAQVKVVWLPYTEGKPGSHFFVKYRVKGEPTFMQTLETMDTDYVIVKGLEPSQVYEFQVASVDGEFVTESAPQEVQMYSVDGPTIDRVESVATAGWFIGMLLAIVFLLLVLILVCIIKRNRGGKYAVHEREAAHGRHDYPEDAGFHEYSQPLDSKSHGRSSLGSDPKAAAESDTDSMAEYGEGDTGRFTEDGSFIGQYGPGNEKKKVEEQPTLSSVATYV